MFRTNVLHERGFCLCIILALQPGQRNCNTKWPRWDQVTGWFGREQAVIYAALNDLALLDANCRHQETVFRKLLKIIAISVRYFQMVVPRDFFYSEGVLTGRQGSGSVCSKREAFILVAKGRVTRSGM